MLPILKNHFLPQTYLRGFASPDEFVDERAPDGKIIGSSKISDICFEKSSEEPAVETLRKPLEQFWGEFKKDQISSLHEKQFLSRKVKVAEFLAKSILLCQFGRSILRDERIGKEGNPTWSEAKMIDKVSTSFKERFLELKWQTFEYDDDLVVTDAPFFIDLGRPSEEMNAANWVRLCFPMTRRHLLHLNQTSYGHVRVDDKLTEIEKADALFWQINTNRVLCQKAQENGFRIFTSPGFAWDNSLAFSIG